MENDLPQIDAPDVAVAETNQRQTFTTIPVPREVVTRVLPGTPVTYRVPHKQSSNWFKEIHNGYMSAQTVMFSQYPSDTLKLLHSENLELHTAAFSQKGSKTIEESQRPRRVAIWLLGEYGGYNSNYVDSILDSFSQWANTKFDNSRVANHVRMTAMFGVDAKQVLEMTKHELVETFHGIEINKAFVMVRWHDGNSFQAAIRDIGRSSGNGESFCPMKNIQDSVVRLSGVCDIPIPLICMKNAAVDCIRQQDFYHILHDVSEEFFNLLIGKPSITFSNETTEKNASRILQPTGCIVRVCNRSLGENGMVNPSCFHGAIVGFANKRRDIEEFLKMSDEEGIRPPISKDENGLGLHLCAVQAEGMQLKDAVSLYGSIGIAGKPIHMPGSWVWVARPAVRPLKSDLLNVFSLLPCSRTSVLPSKPELVPAFERFWAHTTNIYRMIQDGTEFQKVKKSAARSPSPNLVSDLELDERDAAVLAMMQLDMKSQRTTLGDAYAQVSTFNNATHVASNIFQAMASLGIRASLSDMFEFNQKAISRVRKLENAENNGDDCFMKFAEVVLAVSSESKRQKLPTSYEPLCLTAERVRRILKACSLKSSTHTTLERGHGKLEQYKNSLESIILSSTCTQSTKHVSKLMPLLQRPLVQLFETGVKSSNWLNQVECAIADSAAKLIVSAANLNCALFLVIGTLQKDEVFIKHVQLDGSITNGSLDDMCRIAKPKVIILQELDGNKVRIMGTAESRGETFHSRSSTKLFDWLNEDLITCVLKCLTMKERLGGAALCCQQFRSISRLLLEEDLKLSSEQVDCFLDAMKGENIFITGAAGCGKSHVLKTIIKYKKRKNVAVTASTGCAAAIIGAATFHSTCSLGLGKAPSKIIAKRIIDGDRYAYSRLKEMKTLIIDEAGMLTGKLFDKAGDVIGMIKRVYGRGYDAVIANAQATFPFDNIQVILCGDALQLPPVDVHSEGWIFESKSWKKMEFKVHLLEQVHRQQDVKFIEILKRMRVGKSTISDLSYLVQNSRKERQEGALKLYAVNAPADNENELKLADLPGVAHRFCAIDSAQNANVHHDVLQERLKHCQAPRLLILKVGARVMCLKNVDERLVNGSLGSVKRVLPVLDFRNSIKCARVEVEFDGQLGAEPFLHVFETHVSGSEVSQENLFTVRGQDHQKLAQRIQIPLRLAWAVSMHKSQGMSLSNVEVDFSGTFSAGQAYTALSRVKTLEGAYIRGLKLAHMKMVAPKAIKFYEEL